MQDDPVYTGLLNRDPAALTALMEQHLNPVYALVSRILAGAGTAQDVEECASDAFYAAWKQIERYDPHRAPLRTWVLMHAKYVALQRRRQLTRRAESPEALSNEPAAAEPLPDEVLATSEERQELQQALETLPELDRQLVYRRYFLEEAITDLAAAFGLSRTAVDNRLWRARKALRSALGLDRKEAES